MPLGERNRQQLPFEISVGFEFKFVVLFFILCCVDEDLGDDVANGEVGGVDVFARCWVSLPSMCVRCEIC